jgi:hypothetical protein
MKYICKKSLNQKLFAYFAISLSSCSRYNANFKLDQYNQCWLFMTVLSAILWDQWGWPITETPTVTHARRRSLMNFRLRQCFPFPGAK